MQFSSSPAYAHDFSKVAVLLMGIAVFQDCEEELRKLTTNNQLLTTNNEREEYHDIASSMGH